MLLPELCRGLPARLNGAKHAEAETGAGWDRIGQDPVDEGLLQLSVVLNHLNQTISGIFNIL